MDDEPAGVMLSLHAELRSAHRNVSYEEIAFVVRHGRRERRTGVIFCRMLDQTMPADIPPGHDFRRLVGTTVILCECGQFVVTVKRGQQEFVKDRRKAKYCMKQQHVCPCCSHAA